MTWYNPMSWGEQKAPETIRDRNIVGDYLQQGRDSATFTQAPTLDMGPQDQFRQGQLQQVGQLQGIASGQQQGAGELAAQRQVQNALAGQQALARIRGAGGAGLRTAARQSAGLGITGAGMGQQAALQDQMNAQGLLANALTQGRGADINIAGQNAQNTLQQRQMNNQQLQAMLQALLGMNQTEMQGQMANAHPGIGGSLIAAGGQVAGSALSK